MGGCSVQSVDAFNEVSLEDFEISSLDETNVLIIESYNCEL